jgi:hypothetical protein
MFRVPRHRVPERRKRIGKVHKPRNGHGKPQVRVVRVRGTPVICYPAGRAIRFASGIAETPLLKDFVIRPRGRLAIGAANANGFTFGKQAVYWDADLRGFGVLVSGRTTVKSFIVQRDLAGGKTRRVTIASVAQLSLSEAREKARPLLVAMRGGTLGVGAAKRAMDRSVNLIRGMLPPIRLNARTPTDKHPGPAPSVSGGKP